MKLFGDVLSETDNVIDYSVLEKIIKRPIVKPLFRISVLNPDETINYIIPNSDIPTDGISYTESYQNGQRRNITLKLINIGGKYTPSINGIWLSTKFRFDVGLEFKNKEYWFPRGIYIMGDITIAHDNSNREVTIQLKDKYAMFEGKMGTLSEAYEIPVDSDIEQALNGIRNFSTGDGYIFDYQSLVLDPSFVGKKTQSTIRIEEGQNLSNIIDALATQLSAEYYYNNLGHLCFYPLDEVSNDDNKPIIWTYQELNREVQAISMNYKNEEVVNTVKVVGDNIENGVYSAVVTNENPNSPICIARVGKRIAPKYTESNIWSNDLAKDLAKYYLRQSSFVSVGFSCTVGFNPLLAVNNICELDNKDLSMSREKLLITSISYSSTDGAMSLELCNTKELPFTS